MVSLDQVLLLQQKVESAVAKIAELHQAVAQLKAENDALHSKCAELTNALSVKTEQFSTFQSDQSKIEEGILKALERLNAVENTVLSVANAATQTQQTAPVTPTAAQSAPTDAQHTVAPQPVAQQQTASDVPPEQTPVAPQPVAQDPIATPQPASPDNTAEQPAQAFGEASIEPEISFDDAPFSPDQPEDGSQGQLDIY